MASKSVASDAEAKPSDSDSVFCVPTHTVPYPELKVMVHKSQKYDEYGDLNFTKALRPPHFAQAHDYDKKERQFFGELPNPLPSPTSAISMAKAGKGGKKPSVGSAYFILRFNNAWAKLEEDLRTRFGWEAAYPRSNKGGFVQVDKKQPNSAVKVFCKTCYEKLCKKEMLATVNIIIEDNASVSDNEDGSKRLALVVRELYPHPLCCESRKGLPQFLNDPLKSYRDERLFRAVFETNPKEIFGDYCMPLMHKMEYNEINKKEDFPKHAQQINANTELDDDDRHFLSVHKMDRKMEEWIPVKIRIHFKVCQFFGLQREMCDFVSHWEPEENNPTTLKEENEDFHLYIAEESILFGGMDPVKQKTDYTQVTHQQIHSDSAEMESQLRNKEKWGFVTHPGSIVLPVGCRHPRRIYFHDPRSPGNIETVGGPNNASLLFGAKALHGGCTELWKDCYFIDEKGIQRRMWNFVYHAHLDSIHVTRKKGYLDTTGGEDPKFPCYVALHHSLRKANWKASWEYFEGLLTTCQATANRLTKNTTMFEQFPGMSKAIILIMNQIGYKLDWYKYTVGVDDLANNDDSAAVPASNDDSMALPASNDDSAAVPASNDDSTALPASNDIDDSAPALPASNHIDDIAANDYTAALQRKDRKTHKYCSNMDEACISKCGSYLVGRIAREIGKSVNYPTVRKEEQARERKKWRKLALDLEELFQPPNKKQPAKKKPGAKRKAGQTDAVDEPVKKKGQSK